MTKRLKGWISMAFVDHVKAHRDVLVRDILRKQSGDGSWRYCFDSGILTDAYMIIVMRTLEIDDEVLIQRLVKRILNKQKKQTYWQLYADEEGGNLSTTIDAYNGLLFSGYIKKSAPEMRSAANYIRKHGGLKKADLLTKAMLALNGQYPWPPSIHLMPISVLLLPSFLPFNFFDFSSFARSHFVPVLVASNLKYKAKTRWTPSLDHLKIREGHDIDAQESRQEDQSILQKLIQPIQSVIHLPQSIHDNAIKYAEQYMLKRIEPNGTLSSYASSTFLMIYAFLALGYNKDSEILTNAINGLKSLVCKSDPFIHVQNSPSTVWDTALLSYALQEAGVDPDDSWLRKANRFLLNHQQTKYGDWALKAPNVNPGGWGFSDVNTMVPDVDDTTAALRAIKRFTTLDDENITAWNKGITWLFAMQNNDGGWPAFEKNTDNELLTYLPFKEAEAITIDPSSADLTGRTLEFLGNTAGLTMENKDVQLAVAWLINNQKDNGSWQGRWGISYIYGTWAAVTGLMAVGMSSTNPTIKKAVDWLESTQNDDGGWGESCQSDIVKNYVPLNFSTLSQTAWAVDALLSVYNRRNETIDRGIEFLTHREDVSETAMTYPTGAGLPGEFYTYYQSYNYIWPLLTITHYLNLE